MACGGCRKNNNPKPINKTRTTKDNYYSRYKYLTPEQLRRKKALEENEAKDKGGG
jgi:hypothetical protein